MKNSIADSKNSFIKLLFVFFIMGFISIPEISEAKLDGSELELKFAGSYRVDQLDWNFATTSVNIRSELTWEDIESNQFSTEGTYTLHKESFPLGIKFRGKLDYGEIYSGKNQDSDYDGNDRTQEWSRSNNSAEEGDLWDLSLGVGPIFSSKDKKASVAPYIGYSYHEQNLVIQNGYQTIADYPGRTNPVGPFAGLDSNYEARWYSFLVGAMVEYAPNNNFSLHSSIELHTGTFDAKGNWNLRPDLQHPVSFRHESDDAGGVLVNVGLETGVKHLFINIDLNYQKWRAKDGDNFFYESDGDIILTRLNEVNWESFNAMAGFTVRF